ncbi:hypothetical protein GGI17_005913 [Coemansia sp. S146]|nr:hypothetical protein GGI17_005913 [Coemansia sp. S146]
MTALRHRANKSKIGRLVANIAASVQRVKQMASMANKIRFEGDEAGKLLKRRNVYFTALAQELFHMVEIKAVIMCDNSPLVKYLDLWQTCDLGYSEAMSFIHRSTHKLQSLAIVMGFRADPVGLIKDPDSSQFLEYPCLHTQKIFLTNISNASQSSVFNGAVLFPRPRYLNIFSRYPFADGVLFRGNAAILKHFQMAPYSKSVLILTRYNIFTAISHLKLSNVVIRTLRHAL